MIKWILKTRSHKKRKETLEQAVEKLSTEIDWKYAYKVPESIQVFTEIIIWLRIHFLTTYKEV